MRLDWPPPRDLLASALICILALLIVFLSPQQLATYSAPLALLLVVLLPGHLLASCLFPARDEIDVRSRSLFSLGSSAAIGALVSLVLTFTPRGLQPATLATMLSFLSLFLAAVSYLRWSALPYRKRLAARSRRSLRSAALFPLPRRSHFALFLMLAAILALATFALDGSRLQSPLGEKGSTEFNVSWPDGAANASSDLLASGATGSGMARIINREHSLVNYTLQLVHNNTSLFRRDVSLQDNQSWQEPVSFRLDGPAGRKRLDFLLFKEGDSLAPYREEHLWVNVTEIESNEPNNSSEDDISGMINDSGKADASEETPPVVLDQNSRVVVLGLGEKGSHGGSRSGGSKPSQKTDHESEMEFDPHAADSESGQDESTMLQTDSHEGSAREEESPAAEGGDASEEPDKDPLKSEQPEGPAETILEPPLQEEQLSAPAAPKADAAESGPSVAAQAGEKESPDPSEEAQGSGVEASQEKDAPVSPTAAVDKPAPSSDDSRTEASGSSPDAISQKDKDAKPAAINQEINSWVGTRVTASSGKSQRAYESQNIRYVRDDRGERAVLGRSASSAGDPAMSRSREPRRLG